MNKTKAVTLSALLGASTLLGACTTRNHTTLTDARNIVAQPQRLPATPQFAAAQRDLDNLVNTSSPALVQAPAGVDYTGHNVALSPRVVAYEPVLSMNNEEGTPLRPQNYVLNSEAAQNAVLTSIAPFDSPVYTVVNGPQGHFVFVSEDEINPQIYTVITTRPRNGSRAGDNIFTDYDQITTSVGVAFPEDNEAFAQEFKQNYSLALENAGVPLEALIVGGITGSPQLGWAWLGIRGIEQGVETYNFNRTTELPFTMAAENIDAHTVGNVSGDAAIIEQLILSNGTYAIGQVHNADGTPYVNAIWVPTAGQLQKGQAPLNTLASVPTNVVEYRVDVDGNHVPVIEFSDTMATDTSYRFVGAYAQAGAFGLMARSAINDAKNCGSSSGITGGQTGGLGAGR